MAFYCTCHHSWPSSKMFFMLNDFQMFCDCFFFDHSLLFLLLLLLIYLYMFCYRVYVLAKERQRGDRKRVHTQASNHTQEKEDKAHLPKLDRHPTIPSPLSGLWRHMYMHPECFSSHQISTWTLNCTVGFVESSYLNHHTAGWSSPVSLQK